MPKKKVKLNFKPKIKALVQSRVRAQVLAIKKEELDIQKIATERRVRKMVIRGHSLEHIAAKTGITTNEAHKILKDTIQRWMTEESFEAVEVREIMLRQLDSTLALAMHEAFPHPLTDDQGRPVMIRACECPAIRLNKDGTCQVDSHNKQAMSTPNKAWADMVISVIDRKSKMLGTDAAQKLEEQKVDLLKRMYVGVDQKAIDQL